MALEKIRPRVVDETGNYTFNNVTATGSILTAIANIGNITGITNLVANTTTITVTGNLTTTASVSAGNIKTDNVLYANGNPWSISTPPGGSTTQVQFNNSSNFAGSANFTFNTSTNTLVVTNISGNGAQLSSLTASNITGQAANALVSGTVYSNAQPNITSIGTLTSLDITGTVNSGNANLGNTTTSNYFIGNGSLLSSIPGSNITGQVGYAAVANSVSGSNVSGPVTYAATANAVAGANVLGTVGQSTYADTANSVAGANVSGNVTIAIQSHYANIANSVAGSNVSGQVANALIAGTVYTNAQPNITSVGTLSSLTATGNITGGNVVTTGKVYSSDFINGGTGIYLSAGPSGYINFFTTGGDKASISDTGNIIASNVVANSTIFATTSNISGNITAGNANLGNLATANYFSGNGSLLTSIIASSATTAGTVTTNAQPNITSVGSLSGLTVSNATGIVDFTTTANVTLGNVSNLHISGGTADYVLSTNGSGTLSWVAQSGGTTTATIDNFTGNGVQTVFTLSTTPTSENDTIINYNGAILQKNVYSLSGSDITFVAPPASGSSLEITTLGVVSTSGLTTTGKAIAMAIVFGF
jgi:hypothetical protein